MSSSNTQPCPLFTRPNVLRFYCAFALVHLRPRPTLVQSAEAVRDVQRPSDEDGDQAMRGVDLSCR